ncbi:MAG: heterodisulfide reductase-related iron-sulfur binding cluster, partial [Armatimonadota bacterium]
MAARAPQTLDVVGREDGRASVHPPPPFADEVLQCIHCGLCATFCPTYAEARTEMAAPRGRIHLARAVMEGRLRLTREVFQHLDQCLDCRACQTACPSGVEYGALLEKVRAWPEYRRARPLLERAAMAVALRWIMPSPRGLRVAGVMLRLYQGLGLQFLLRRSGLTALLPRRIRAAEQLLPPRLERHLPALPRVMPARGERRARVGFLSGCVMDMMLRSVNWASAEVLARNGCEVITPLGQRCCGGLHVHQGELGAARELARHNIDVFERAEVDAIVVNAAGCGSTMKEYAELLSDDPVYAKRAASFAEKTRDITEFLIALPL